jgi:hypothetical protein
MSTLPVLRKMFSSAAFVLAVSLTLVAFEGAVAQQEQQQRGSGLFKKPHRGPVIGGTSWTLSDVWGEPEMPPAPKDFGPGFDYSPGGYTLDGAPNNAPYPN